MSDATTPPTPPTPPGAADAFTALLADTTAIAPATRFADDLRRRLLTELDDLSRSTPTEDTMTTTVITTATATATATVATETTAIDLEVVNTVTPYLCVNGAAAAIDFYVGAFGAVEHHRMVGDDGRIGHAEIVIGGSRLMLADEYPEVGVLSPTTRGGTSTNFTLNVADVHATFARALELGATQVRPVEDQFYGFRQGTLRDPFGHQWSLSQPIAGFDDAQYVDNSAAEGYAVIAAPDVPIVAPVTPVTPVEIPRANVPADAADIPDELQIKRHVGGDLYYFTLPVRDLARGQRFFSAVLGWQFTHADNGHVGNITAPPGGLDERADTGARLWFVVDDIHTAVERVRAAGGTAQEPVLYDSGWSADCVDDQGTVFSLSVPSADYSR